MPKVSEEHLEARRRQILRAASACFAREGFHRTTMQDICREAGLSPGAVYRYFRSKEAIIEAMAEQSRRRNLALIDLVRERDDTLLALRDLGQIFIGALDQQPQQVASLDIALWAEALRNPQVRAVLRRNSRSHREALSLVVRDAQRRGDINPDLDPAAVARVLLALFQGLVLQKGIDGEVDTAAYLAAVRSMVLGSFWQGAGALDNSPTEDAHQPAASPDP